MSEEQKYWEAIGGSACPDDIMRDISIKEISKYLKPGMDILDLGCGNGYCTYEFSKAKPNSILGVDYSKTSIQAANVELNNSTNELRKVMRFQQGNALDLKEFNSSFDTIISIRCLINVGDMDCIKKAFNEIYNALKPGGRYLMCENFVSGLNIINESRKAVGLNEIKTRWHNTCIDDDQFYQWAKSLYTEYEVNHFLSTYFFVSRVVNGWIADQNNEEPKYDSDINRMASLLPSHGEYSPMRLIILQK